MWFGMMWWWLIPLLIFLALRGHHGRRYWRGHYEGDRLELAELRQVVESQQDYIEQLEGRLGRVEDGLEFAERLIGQRSAG
jgi:hypothetical protein